VVALFVSQGPLPHLCYRLRGTWSLLCVQGATEVAPLRDIIDYWLAWFCLQLGSSGCYSLSLSETATYLAGMIVVLFAAGLLLHGVLMRILVR